MAAAGSGAVFFLGTRAHYQVLQQPETRCDIENGNTTETVYQNPSVQMWSKLDNVRMDQNYVNGTGNYYCDLNEVNVIDNKEIENSVKKRNKRNSSETTLCERDEIKPSVLNDITDNETPKEKRRSLLAFLSSLARRKKRCDGSQLHYLQSALTNCTYRESCRCLECQSRYFECDEEMLDDYSSDDSDFTMYVAQAQAMAAQPPEEEDECDEVFSEQAPDDNTSTDLLLEPKEEVPIASDTEPEQPDLMQLEVAAGTPVLLNYLLTHPITCAIQ